MQGADPTFERAFVAVSYLLGDRDLDTMPVDSPEARTLVSALGSASRDARAAVLAKELARVALALERSNLPWSHDQGAG
jgi:hypothetical protein